MLEDFFLQTNEVSLERVGGQTIASDDSVDNDLADDIELWEEREKEEDVVKTYINEKEIQVSLVKSKSLKMSFQVLPFLVFHLL